MGLTLIAAATAAPVDLEEVKRWCKIDVNDDDAIVEMLTNAATAEVQDQIGRAVAEQTWMLTLEGFEDEVELAPGPVISIDAVEYLDEDRVSRLVPPESYFLDAFSNPARLVRDPDVSWPATADSIIPGVVSITFTSGPEEADPRVKAAIMALVAQWYDNRIPGEIPAGVMRTLQPLRRVVL